MSAQRDVIFSAGMPTGDAVHIVRRRFVGAPGPRVAIVAGIRGDTPEGVRVAHKVASLLEQHHDALRGTVDIYPCVNPLAAHRGERYWPFFSQDLNRCFPGRLEGHAPDRVAYTLTEEVRDAAQVIELRGANPAFSEAPQAHVRARDTQAADLARHANVNVVWARQPGPAAGSTFAWQHPNTLVLEGGTGNRLQPKVGVALTEGVLNVLNVLGVLPDAILPFHWATITRPLMVGDDRVHRVRAVAGGLFLPSRGVWDEVEAGDVIGEIIEATAGEPIETIRAPASGRILAMREQPVVLPGSMLARVVVTATQESA
ncbi:MAG: succinylglutamate desuccinylase/aspartoacylase family protein [Deltaproteobacteria bacterium]|nr:succinylglutamate desuccinylase/aspartoacylase family protein [Deltaproteobacteria bacterium]